MFEKVTGVQNIYLIYVFKTGRSKTIVFIGNIDLLKRRKNKEKLYLKKIWRIQRDGGVRVLAISGVLNKDLRM